MTALVLKVTPQGFEAIERRLSRLNPLQQDTLLAGLGRLIREQTVERLQKGGPSPAGQAWTPNREGRKPILFRSGALARSIDYAVGGAQLVVGSGLVYAAIHQFGGVILPKESPRLAFRIGNRMVFARKVTMPARPYIGLSPADRREVILAAVQYIRRVLA